MAKINKNKIKLIYNPAAGKKKRLLSLKKGVTLEEIKELLVQYQLQADFSPTKNAKDARKLAIQAMKSGYTTVLVAGGDGTLAEVASCLVGSEVTLGIIPLGSYMNIARMLSIPRELEQAIQLIKIGRTRKIDVGSITRIDGEKLKESEYFFEEASIGIEAEIHYYLTGIFERQEYSSIFKILKVIFKFYNHPVNIKIDDKEFETKATLVTISNGPISDASLELAPKSRLNDHEFTLSLYKLSKISLFIHFLKLLLNKPSYSKKIKVYKGKNIQIKGNKPRPVHADARVFGTIPIELKIIPGSLNMITGFPKLEEKYLEKRTYLDQ